MTDKKKEFLNSEVHKEAIVHDYTTLINSKVGRMCVIGKFSKMAYSSLLDLSYIGEYTIVINSSIGKFTSISWGVTIGPEEHDYNKVTNHSFLYSTKSFKLSNTKYYSPFEKECVIGNDVWIGCNSTILRGVTIGDGAVIGANSLVNKDVPPYAVVVGSPARLVKFRFSEEIIIKMEEIKWWDMPLDLISANAELFNRTPDLSVIEKLMILKRNEA
jgi:virginiamycin A acetyltransferase